MAHRAGPIRRPAEAGRRVEPALAEALADRREVLDELVDATTGELRDLLRVQVDSQQALDTALLDGWDEERARLATVHGAAWQRTAVGDDVTRDDGEPVDEYDHGWSRGLAEQRLVVGCRAPELAGGPAQDTSEDPPAGRLASFRPVDEGSPTRAGDLVATDESGAGERPRELSEVPGRATAPAGGRPRAGSTPDRPGPATSSSTPAPSPSSALHHGGRSLVQTGDDVLGSGIVVVDLATGEAERVATGVAASPTWSPDGEWLVFAYSPLGEGEGIGTWMARPDGTQLRRVFGPAAWFSLWLA